MDLTANKEGQPVAPGLAPNSTANPENVTGPRSRATQTYLFEPAEIAPQSIEIAPLGTDIERAYARRAADVLGDYLANHSTGTLEAALAAAHLAPPPGVRLYVAHPLAVRWAQRDGLAVQTGGATHASAPQANRGLVRVYRGPRE